MYEGSYQPRARQHSLYMCLSMALESADMAHIQLLLMCHRLWRSGPITAALTCLPVWPHFPPKNKKLQLNGWHLAEGAACVSARNNTGREPQSQWQTDGPGDTTPSGSQYQYAVIIAAAFPKHICWQICHFCVGAVTLYRVRGGNEQHFQSWSWTESQWFFFQDGWGSSLWFFLTVGEKPPLVSCHILCCICHQ